MMHPTAAKGFVRPDLYEKGRPDYPEAVVAALALGPASRVSDLGCGTGKLTRMLAATGARVVGIDPLTDMLSAFHRALPDTPAVAGLAEAIPLQDACCDVVVCASAFHWFDHDRAIPEIRRVLRTGGTLRIVWNRRDELEGWAEGFWKITEAYRGDTPGYRSAGWRRALESSPAFGDVDEQWFPHSQRVDLEGLLARVASISFIETLPEEDRRRVLEDSKRFVHEHPQTRGRSEFVLPYRTVLYSAVAR